MVIPSERNQAWTWLSLVLWTAAGAAGSEAAGSRVEGKVSLDPAAIFSRIMSANAQKAAEAERPLPGDITRKLWRSRVSAPEPTDDAQTQIAVDDLVRKIRSMKFPAREQEPPGVPTFVMPEPVANHVEATSTREGSRQQVSQPARTAPAAPDESLPAEAADALKRVLADPNQAGDPQELAELLYLTGRFAEAAVLYQKALDLTTGKEPAAREDQAWMLLQLGNCLRDTDPARARNAYAKLIAEHADCPWVEIAKAHSQLITWYEQVQPRRWIAGQEAPPARQVAASRRSQP